MKTNNLVLASSSTYRKSLLQKLQLDFICAKSDIDERKIMNESSAQMALRLAEEKASALTSQYPHHFIIASDQVAMVKHMQLTKPGNEKNAIKQLLLSSGESVQFFTSVCVLNTSTGESKTAIDTSTVHFKKLTEQQIKNYIKLEKPYDCAGSFKSEGLGIALFERIQSNDPNSLVGLPLIKLISLLEEFNICIFSNE